MDKEAIAIELLRKVGSAGVTPGSIELVLEAFNAVSAPAAAPAKKAAAVAAAAPAAVEAPAS